MIRFLTLAFLLCAVALGPSTASRGEDVKANPDNNFLISAVTAGVGEVKFSQLAEKHASNDDVKEFAGRLVKEHNDANKKLLEHARGLKVAVVTGLDKEQRTAFSNMSKLKGDEFDREYIHKMVEDHEKAIKLFEDYSKTGTNDDLKQFATKTLPTLKHHLEEAKKIEAKIKK
jgi:putative membrane protein